jgi:hypothetical protein
MKRATPRVGRLLAPLLIALCLFAPAVATAAEEGVHVPELLSAFEAQLKAKQVASVTFNKRLRSMRVTLTDGKLYLAKYPPKDSAAWIAKVKAANVSVTVLTPTQAKKEAGKKPVKHKIRYIVGGVVLVLIVIGVVVLLLRRRRQVD